MKTWGSKIFILNLFVFGKLGKECTIVFLKKIKILSKKKYLTFYIHVEETDLRIFRPKSVFYLKKRVR